jgi:hypothetical protein
MFLFASLALALVHTAASQGVNARLYACDASSPTQQWQPGPTDNEIVQKNGGACLDVDVRYALVCSRFASDPALNGGYF